MTEPVAHDGPLPESFEATPSREIQRDEDVLSHDFQLALEGVGTAVGFVAAVALVFAHAVRGARAVAAIRASPADARATRGRHG